MRYKSAPILICLVAAALSCARPPPIAHDEVLVTALASIALTPADLAISGDTLADADRFDKVKKLLENPQDAMDILPAFDTLTAGALLGAIAPWLGPDLPGSPVASPEPEVPEPLQALVRSLMICQGRLARVYGSFSAEDRRRFASFIHLVHPGVALTETASDSLIAIGRRIDRAELVAATRALLTEVDTFVASVPALIPGTYDTPAGRVVIGGIGPDDYASPAALIIDPGGDDRYACFPDSLRWGSLSLVIDFSGDDTYEGPSGCGFGGVGIVIDLAGEDRYAGTGTGQGAGIGGVGGLVDRAGAD
ncbi:MAG: hypothetical protein O3B73_06355, partial [bacterium]|nr:hypothetical protein [bacterium]